MRTLLAAVTTSLSIASPLSLSCDRDAAPKVNSVRFAEREATGSATKSSKRKGELRQRFTVTADISSGGSYEVGLVLIASMDMIIAPRELPTLDVPGKEIENEVSWGVLATEENLRAVVLSDLRPCTSIAVKTFEVDLDSFIQKDFFEGDGLWPWVIRVQVTLLDRNGSVIARGEGKMHNPWRAAASAQESPNTSLERTRER
jgi:hypothetical protein